MKLHRLISRRRKDCLKQSSLRRPRLNAAAAVCVMAAVVLTGMLQPAWAESRIPIGDPAYDDAGESLFRDSELTFIEVTMAPADLQACLDNPYSDEYRPCTVHIANSVIDETIEDVGIRPRGNTSREAIKKSWKLRFNYFVPGREFHGVEKLNINGEHNDVSIIRSKLAWDLFREMHVPAPRACHVHFKINDGSVVEGIHINVEQIDDEFVEAWFGNDTGNLYKCLYQGVKADLKYVPPGTAETYETLGGGTTYQEENNEDSPDYSDLAAFIDFINNTDDATFAAGIVDRLSVDNFLRTMAIDVTIGQWDNYWYGANNYYLYHNPDTDRFEFIPYDYDNTYGIDFFGIDWARRPYDTWGDGGYGGEPGSGGDDIVSTEPSPPIAGGNVVISYNPAGRPLDGAPHVYIHYGLNNWSQIMWPDSAMSWDSAEETWEITLPLPGDTWQLDMVFNDGDGTWDNNGGRDWHFAVSGSGKGDEQRNKSRDWQSPPLIERILAIPAYEAQYRRYLRTLANGPFALATTEQKIDSIQSMIAPYAFEGSYDDGWMDWSYTTQHFIESYTQPTDYRDWGWGWDWGLKPFIQTRAAYLTANVPEPNPLPRLSINEMCAGNNTIIADEAGQYEDWIEIYNDENAVVDVGGMYLTDDPGMPRKWQLPAGTMIAANSFLLVWCDDDAADGPLHASFKLSGDGEGAGLYHDDAHGNALIDYAAYPAIRDDVSFGRYPDGVEAWGFMAIPTPAASNLPHNAPPFITDVSHTPIVPTPFDVVSIVATITDDGAVTEVNLFYATGSGFVSTPMFDDGTHGDGVAGDHQYGTILPAQAPGCNVSYYVVATDDEAATYSDPATAPAETYGYIVDYNAPQLVINEFMADNDGIIDDPDEPGEYADWIELYNAGTTTVQLGGMYLTDDLADPTQFAIPAGVSIAAGETLLFWADDDTEQGPLHTNFKLGKEGEAIGLYDTDATGNVEIDAIVFGQQQTDVAFGRYPDGAANWGFLLTPTPGWRNGLAGDLDCSQTLDQDDIELFVMAILSPDDYAAAYPSCGAMLADTNADGHIDGLDIAGFIEALFP